MSNNAQFRVRYVNLTASYYDERALYLSSPDLLDARKAFRRARDTAKARLEKKLGKGKVKILSTDCVG